MPNETAYVILDAKHKIMNQSEDLPDNASRRVANERLNRNDLYQVVSYANTHSVRLKAGRRTAFVLVGLNDEVGEKQTVVETLPSVVIRSGEKTTTVHRLAMNFGEAMRRIGRALLDSTPVEQVHAAIGNELIASLAAVSEKRVAQG